ncbi:MraY-like glycosyltransferase [Adhaeretor mobilis]|uniref:MraY-like glycosyltransferase n=2 Tax=Adhaeretor mobilis TaxID=1930276 RepID=A0A517MXW2_9BACT|nr:MraY-like glycosyltransferase [Adhaeretor mobilis]
MDVPKKDLSRDLPRIDREDLSVAMKFVATLLAALVFLPPGGILWQPGAATTVSSWFVKTLLAFVA